MPDTLPIASAPNLDGESANNLLPLANSILTMHAAGGERAVRAARSYFSAVIPAGTPDADVLAAYKRHGIYALMRHWSTNLRTGGFITAARYAEGLCDQDYGKMPAWAKW